MGEVVAFAVIMLIAITAFQAALGLSFTLVIYGPGAYFAIAAGWYGVQLGAELQWGIGIGLATGVTVRAFTISFLRYLTRTLSL